MTQLDEAISRYHRILESEPYRDLRWVKNLQDEMEARQLSAGGRLLCPFLRPNFVTQKQYDNLVKTGEALISAVDRMLRAALTSPQLLSRMQLFPAEKMLAAIDPGYEMAEVSAQLDLQIQNGSLHVMQYNADALTGAAWSEGLSDLFFDCPPVKEFRRRYTLTRVGGKKPFLSALLKAYKIFATGMLGAGMPGREASLANGREASPATGIKQKPNIAILEFRDPTGRSEYEIYRDYFRAEGFQSELVSPDQLEYRNGVLRSGNFDIDLIYRRISVQEFLLRFTLNHPLVHAYRDHRVCVVNSFRSELSHKKAMFALLTDESLTAKFPINERKAIREHVPWTRFVKSGKTQYHEETIDDLIEYIKQNREKLVLRPNDEYSDMHSFIGYEHDEGSWARALREALRAPYVVQERVKPARTVFPLMNYGHLEFKEMQVDVQPQAYLGKVAGCSSYVSSSGPGSYSPASGFTPTFIIDPKS